MRHFLSYTTLLSVFITVETIAEPSMFVVNLNSRIHVNLETAISIQLNKGKYIVTPISKEQGGMYSAANRFQEVTECSGSNGNCMHGWEHSYLIVVGEATPAKFGCGEGHGPLDCGAYYPNETVAFQNAVASEFVLATPTTVKFFFRDDNLIDNEGGISLILQQNKTSICNEKVTGTVSPNLDMHLPSLNYQSLTVTQSIWADLEFYGQGTNSELLWKLKNFGVNQK